MCGWILLVVQRTRLLGWHNKCRPPLRVVCLRVRGKRRQCSPYHCCASTCCRSQSMLAGRDTDQRIGPTAPPMAGDIRGGCRVLVSAQRERLFVVATGKDREPLLGQGERLALIRKVNYVRHAPRIPQL